METPYAAGQCCKGVGVDCVRFVNAGLAFRAGDPVPPELPRFAQDAAFHDPRVVSDLLKFWTKLYPCDRVDVASSGKIGDVVVVASGEVNETHVCMDGGNGFLYHAIAPSVCRTSREEYRGRIKRIFRVCSTL